MKIGRRRKRFLLDNYLFVGRNSVTLVTTQHDHLHGHGGMLLYVRPTVQFYLLNDLLSHHLLLLRNKSCPQQTWNQKIFNILLKRIKILKIRQLDTKGGNVFLGHPQFLLLHPEKRLHVKWENWIQQNYSISNAFIAAHKMFQEKCVIKVRSLFVF